MLTIMSRIGAVTHAPWIRIRVLYKKYALNINLGALLTLFIIVALWQWITVVVPAGHIGVKWYRFTGGTDTESIYGEGNHFIWPWDQMAIYDARLQLINRDFDFLSRDGLMMTVNIAVRYRLNPTKVGQLHKHVASDYVETLLIPAVGSYARSIFSQNSTDDVYTDRRTAIQDEIKQALVAELNHDFGQRYQSKVPWLLLDDVLIRSIRFPPEVQSAINRKMEEYQLKNEYTYRLQREELESQRKEVEARGIARFQSIVGAGISDTYLRWKGIDATLALARSPNAKVVVIGTARDGMPLILGGADISGPSGSPTSGETGSAALAKSEVPVDTPPPPIFDQQSITPPMPADQSAPLTQTLRKNQIRRPNALDTVRAPSSASAVDVSPSSATADEAHRE